MIQSDTQKRSIAYHEAGHAAVAYELGAAVTKILLISGNEWTGKTHITWPNSHSAPIAASLAAGAIAQEKGEPGSIGLFTDRGDVNKLNEFANAEMDNQHLIGPFALPDDKRKREAFLRQAEKKAQQIIENNWEKIQRLAMSLLTSHHLDEEQITNLLK